MNKNGLDSIANLMCYGLFYGMFIAVELGTYLYPT